MSDYKGSKKHILEWIGDNKQALSKKVMELVDIKRLGKLERFEVDIKDLWWFPIRKEKAEEKQIASINLMPIGPQKNELKEWWVKYEGKTPTWDFICNCKIDEIPGIVMVEAKAHKGELKSEGKGLNVGNVASLSNQLQNHDQIGRAIAEAKGGLSTFIKGVNISRDSHYQLSNRIAFAWKLASLGIPVILIYLGFYGDNYFKDKFDKNTCEDDIRQYINDVFPIKEKEGQEIPCGNASFWFIVRSMECP